MRKLLKECRSGRLETLLLAASGMVLSACAAPQYQTVAPLDAAAKVVMEQTTQQALELNKDGQGSNWSIPESGHVGTVIPTRTYQTNSGQSCREFQQTVTVGGTTRLANGTACRKIEGGWQRVDYTGLADIGSDRTAYGHGYPHYGYGYRPYYPHLRFGLFFGHGHRFGHRHRYHRFHGYPHYKLHYGHHRFY